MSTGKTGKTGKTGWTATAQAGSAPVDTRFAAFAAVHTSMDRSPRGRAFMQPGRGARVRPGFVVEV